jgi:glycosyltransferase involved in cell wall biosynthesis
MMGKLAKSLHQKHPFSLVHCRSYISALIGLKFKQQLGIPFLFDMRGFWADERIEGGIWNKSNPLFGIIYSYFKKKERAFFSQSDAIVSLTHKGKKIILDWNIKQVSAEKISVIPCCVDLDQFNLQNAADTAIKNELKASLQVPTDARIVGYLGSIGTWYMLNEMLAFFKLYKEKYPNAVFLFISTDPIEHIKNAAQLLGIDKDSIIQTACLHSDVPKYISLFDISVFFIRPSFSKQASSPTKQGEIMAMGIPIVCNTGVGDTDEIIQQYNSGSLVTLTNQTANERSFKEAIDQLESQFDQPSTINGANVYFSLEKGIESYKKIYKRLIN